MNRSSVDNILDRLFVKNKYNRHVRPSANMGKPTICGRTGLKLTSLTNAPSTKEKKLFLLQIVFFFIEIK